MVGATGDKYEAISEDASKLRDTASPFLSSALQDMMDTEPVKDITDKISAIVSGIPVLLSLLDNVAEIHPFIKGSFLHLRTGYMSPWHSSSISVSRGWCVPSRG